MDSCISTLVGNCTNFVKAEELCDASKVAYANRIENIVAVILVFIMSMAVLARVLLGQSKQKLGLIQLAVGYGLYAFFYFCSCMVIPLWNNP